MADEFEGSQVLAQADTQPTTDSQTVVTMDIESVENAWGRLYPITIKEKNPFNLVNSKYSIGRACECDITLTENDMGKTLYLQISKLQFTIEKLVLESGSIAAMVTDHSTNGTFINGVRIGKNKMQIISNNDFIAVAAALSKIFVFMELNNCCKDGIPGQVKRQYHIADLLGKGGFGEVRLVLEKPNIVRWHDTMKANDHIFLVLEYMQGGDLAQRLMACKKFSESVTKHIFYQILLGVFHLHKNNVIHRDLKPANILLSSSEDYPIVKISDFGLSKILTKSTTRIHTICGTPNFSAPEIMYTNSPGVYDCKVDVWSLGVILFLCLSGDLPFTKRRRDMPLADQIKNGSYKFEPHKWKSIDERAKIMIRRMLRVLPLMRATVGEVLSSPWINQDTNMKVKVLEMVDCQKENVDDLCRSNPSKRFRQA